MNLFILEHTGEEHGHHIDENMHEESDPLATGLGIAIGLFGILLVLAFALYYFIRRGITIECLNQGRGSRGDIQELTTHFQPTPSNHTNSTVIASSDVENQQFGYDNNIAEFSGGATRINGLTGDNNSFDTASKRLDMLKSNVWTVPRNFLELTHEVVGRGKFGSVIKASVNNRGQKMVNACVQVVPGNIPLSKEFIDSNPFNSMNKIYRFYELLQFLDF